MAFTYDFDLKPTVARLRVLIPDNDDATYVFEDAELEVFYGLEGNSIKRGAALALETIASNEAMVLKVVRLLDLSTDGAKVSDALLKRAALLRRQADDGEVAAGASFDIAEMVFSPFGWREYLGNIYQRG
jgi:hypothetical protein